MAAPLRLTQPGLLVLSVGCTCKTIHCVQGLVPGVFTSVGISIYIHYNTDTAKDRVTHTMHFDSSHKTIFTQMVNSP